MAGNIAKYAKAAGALLSVATLAFDLCQKNEENKRRKEIETIKNKFNDQIRGYAKDLGKNLRDSLLQYMRFSFDDKIEQLDKEKLEIVNLSNGNKKFSEAINKLDSEYIDFIETIEKN